jgi:hypothetical protein
MKLSKREELMHQKIQKLLAENEKLRGNVPESQFRALEKKAENYKKIIDSAEFDAWLYHKNKCKKNGLKSYFFAFKKSEFDAFVKRINTSPNNYFRNIIKNGR